LVRKLPEDSTHVGVPAHHASSPDEGLRERVATLDRLAREVEGPAEAEEVAIWRELQGGRLPR
jgi:hypothetical protein